MESKEFIELIFNLHEIELLSENMVRIHMTIDEEEIDTIVTYTKDDKQIIIEALAGSDLISYNESEDEFVVCGFTTYAIPGPNVTNPGPPYFQFNIEECQEGGDLNAQIDYVIASYDYKSLDTIGIFLTKFVYKP